MAGTTALHHINITASLTKARTSRFTALPWLCWDIQGLCVSSLCGYDSVVGLNIHTAFDYFMLVLVVAVWVWVSIPFKMAYTHIFDLGLRIGELTIFWIKHYMTQGRLGYRLHRYLLSFLKCSLPRFLRFGLENTIFYSPRLEFILYVTSVSIWPLVVERQYTSMSSLTTRKTLKLLISRNP